MHIPMLYGERGGCILVITLRGYRDIHGRFNVCVDDTQCAHLNSRRGLMANSPEEFKGSQRITRCSGSFPTTDRGVGMTEKV